MRYPALLFTVLTGTTGWAQLFGPQNDITRSTSWPHGAVAADLDGDGDHDVIVASNSDDKISWFRNDGENGFAQARIITSRADGAIAVDAVDLDGDGDIDVLAASSNDDRVAWYANDGNGGFADQAIISTEMLDTRFAEAADIDGDGDPDVLSGTYGAEVFWFANDGAGTFGPPQAISTGGGTSSVKSARAADLDGDGDLDVLIGGYTTSELYWHRNEGSGVFGPRQMIDDPTGSAYITSVDAADLDGDGDLDAISGCSYGTERIAWYRNDGNGAFAAQPAISTDVDGVEHVSTADLDGDGDMDVLSACRMGDRVNTHLNLGNGTFAQYALAGPNDAPHWVIAADLDGDPYPDVLCTTYGASQVAWYSNTGNGQFGARRVISTPITAPNSIDAADLDGDGDLDVLTASTYTSTAVVSWYRNDGAGTFGDRATITTLASGVQCAIATDLDGDGDADVISASPSDNKLAWYANDGTGAFGPQQVISTEGSGAWAVHAADVDGDGDPDLLCASRNDGEIACYRNTGNGTFQTQQLISAQADGAVDVHAADLDGDGDLDVLSASEDDMKIAWYANDGNGAFSAQQVLGQVPEAQCVRTADLDGDGDLDVISAGSYGPVRTHLNDGTGAFGPALVLAPGANGRHVYVSDLDADGDPDVLTATPSDDHFAWYANDGSATFGAGEIIYAAVMAAHCVHAADLDGDGDPDALSGARTDYSVGWYANFSGRGCTDPAACNHDPAAYENDGSCCYSSCGCTIPGATNYAPDAVCDNGTCRFRMQGTVFFDENENGIQDNGEYGLALRQVTILPEGLTVITNASGQFSTYVNGNHTRTVTLAPDPLFPHHTTPASLTFDGSQANWNQHVLFGLSDQVADFELEVSLYPLGGGYPCDVMRDHTISFRNTGNVPLDGVVQLHYDSLFQGHGPSALIDSVTGNTVHLGFQDLLPGEVRTYHVALHTPTVDLLGEVLTTTARVRGYFDNDEVAYGEQVRHVPVTCAYDPNDKQVFPPGYTEAHYIAADTVLEYLVRFQNMGNAPATDVVVHDTLDPHLDLSTFQLVANSHSVLTVIDPHTRAVEFLFEHIMLPDSSSDGPGSQGHLAFKVRPVPGTPLLTEVHNSAWIRFDGNPPIVTNTTWSTLYDCSLFAVEAVQEGALLTASAGDHHQWFLDGEAVPGATAQTYLATQSGLYAVLVGSDFPCSGMSATVLVLITPVEEWGAGTVDLFPNPMVHSATLDLGPLRGTVQVDILDMHGRMVRSEVFTSHQGSLRIPRGHLAKGTYLLRLTAAQWTKELLFSAE